MANLNRRNGQVGLKNGKTGLEELIGVEPTQSEVVLPLAPPRPEYPVGDYGVLASKEKPSWRNWSKWKKRIVAASLTLTSTVLVYGFLEGVLRISGYHPQGHTQDTLGIFSFEQGVVLKGDKFIDAYGRLVDPKTYIYIADKRKFWTLNPDHPEVNSMSLRELREIPPKKKGQYYILCLGDSCTFGHGLPPDQTWAHKLENMLNADGTASTNYLVINGGVPGYSTFEGKYRLDDLLILKPDLAIIYFGWNDGAYTDKTPDHTKRIDTPVLSEIITAAHSVLDRTATYHWLKETPVFQQIISARNHGFSRSDNLWVRVPLDNFIENIKEMIEKCRNHNITPLLVTVPYYKSLDPSQATGMSRNIEEYNLAIKSIAAEYKLYLLDLEREVAELPSEKIDTLFFGKNTKQCKNCPTIDIVHPNPTGTDVWAEQFKGAVNEINQIQSVNLESLFYAPHDPVHSSVSGFRLVAQGFYPPQDAPVHLTNRDLQTRNATLRDGSYHAMHRKTPGR